MRTAHSLPPYGGFSVQEGLLTETPLDRDPHLPGQKPPLLGQKPPPLDRNSHPWTEPPQTDRDPHTLERDLLDKDPPGQRRPGQRPPGPRPPDRDLTGQRPPRGNMGPERETPLEGTWDQVARQEVTTYREPLPL